MSSSKLSPSYYGYVGSTKDALLIIQEILDKQLELVPRRPHERERTSLIKSGNVFVFIEEHSGIKRWTDGIAWSPSRILGRFLVYRELDKHSLSEKDDKKKKKRKVSLDSDPLDKSSTIPHAQQLLHLQNDATSSATTASSSDYNKDLLGTPIVSSYVFKDQGLIKKTLSLTTTTKDLHVDKKEEKQTIHLISYYNADDVLNGKLQRPSETDLKNANIANGLWNAVKDSSLGGKIPIEDEAYYFLDTNYQLQNMSLLQQPPMQNNSANPPVQYLSQKYGVPQPITSGYQQQQPPHQQYMLPVPPQPQSQPSQDYSGGYKREDESSSNELTFINPFTGNSHSQISYNNNNSSSTITGGGSAPGSTSGASAAAAAAAATTAPMFNNYLAPTQYQQQQYGFVQPQQPQQQQPPQQHDANSTGGQTYFPPFPQHFQQPVYPQYHFGSTTSSSDQYSINGSNANVSNGGSVSSISSSMVHGSTQNSFSGPPTGGASGQKKQYRASTSGPTTGGGPNPNTTGGSWFTTNPPNGYVASAVPSYSSNANDYNSSSGTSTSNNDGSAIGGIASPLPHNIPSHYNHSIPSQGQHHHQHFTSHPLANSTTSASASGAGAGAGNTNDENPTNPTTTIGNTGLYSYANN